MIIFPAVDIQNAKAVRLYKGDFSTAEQVAKSPESAVKSFEDAGATWVHMVDLDGAKEGSTVNFPVFSQIAKMTSVNIQVGGGIRTSETVEKYLQAGIKRVILGSAALKSPDFVRQMAEQFGDRIAVGIDAKNRMVSTEGWLSDSRTDFIDLAKKMEDIGIKIIIFTDISKDGTMSGPNFEQLDEINRKVSCKIIASGGISCMDDLKRIAGMGIFGAICGKSVYNGAISVEEAVKCLQNG